MCEESVSSGVCKLCLLLFVSGSECVLCMSGCVCEVCVVVCVSGGVSSSKGIVVLFSSSGVERG